MRDRVAVLNAESRAAASGTPGTNPAKAATPARAAASSKSKQKSAAELAEDERVRRLGALDDLSSSLWRLGHPVENIVYYLASSQIKSATSGSVLLVGEAGCGKSHLVADLASERVAKDLPTFLLLGQHLVPGVVDPQLVAAMGLGSMTLADVLQALDVAARVRRRGRALLVIDAINEGAGADVWESQLPGFVEAVADYPWVAVVITVRDVYETSLAPAGTPTDMTRSVHRGLAGHEEEALTLYASMYKLRLPDVPSLLPELTNPLFLRSLCQSVQGRGLDAIPREAASLVWVFSGLIAAVDKALRHPGRLNYPDWETKAFDAVRALAAAMVDENAEVLPVADADAVCQAIYPETQHSKSLLNGLTVEGLVLRERVDRDGTRVDTVRFTYQRLSDHLRAQAILDRNPTSTKLAAAVRALSTGPRRWATSGVVSALTLLVPETRGTELATVLRLGDTVIADRAVHDSPAAWLRGRVQRAFMGTLMWRSPATWTPTTDRLLKRYLDAGLVESYEWLRILSSLACVPDHPLNVERLHPKLFSLSLADLDQHWSREIGWLFTEDVNPVARTIEWAWANPDAPEDSTRLASVYLAWLFTSSNRRLRDTATKALVSVTTNHPGVLTDLVVRFAHVNDPYVLDRVVAAAYGHILRRRHHIKTPDDLAALRLLAQAVFDAVFDAPVPITHLMLRNRARMSAQVVDTLCRTTGGELGRDLARAQPPYSSPWPLTAPTGRQLARGFGRKWDGYLGSATEIDWEFEENLERRFLDKIVLPDQEGLRTRRRGVLTRRRAKALEALVHATAPSRKVRVRRRAEALIADPPATAWAFDSVWNDFEASFPKASKTPAHELRMVVYELERIDEHVFHPTADLCTRWIAARMLDLGWTKEQFGEVDSRQASLPGERPMERIAKKYERIAFQELCGHLMDHCQLDAPWRGAPRNYDGPWQIYETVDVDPSLLVRGDATEADTPAARLAAIRHREENRPTWWRTLADHQLKPDGTNDSWLGVRSDIPRPDATLTATDPKGSEWVALERHQEWKIEDPSDLGRSYRRDRRRLWLRSQANIIRADDVAHPQWAANTNWMGLNHLSTSAKMWIDGLGEYPDIAGWPAELDLADQEHRPYEPDDDPGTIVLPLGFEFARIDDETRSPYAMATVGCHQESGQDF